MIRSTMPHDELNIFDSRRPASPERGILSGHADFLPTNLTITRIPRATTICPASFSSQAAQAWDSGRATICPIFLI
jgi:hypothetical protein